ncbi:MAG: hypothetical protein RQ824_02940 [bacterium]|nr:hypothetical protein [bacterium]
MDSIAEAPTLTIGKFAWTITDVVDSRDSNLPFIYGRLSKFSREGHVTVVDTSLKYQVDALAENLLVASSPFVYLPTYSGIAYLHVWNGIQEEIFPRRFKAIIEETYDGFFVDCSIEPVADYRAFTSKLREIDLFTEISSNVYPPNPLFGRLWGSLKDYVKKRNATEFFVKESSEEGKGLKTNIIDLMIGIIENPQYEPKETPDITDAALLMAADGYGRGKVVGESDGVEIIIKTTETQKSFLHTKEPEPKEFATECAKHFKQISKERDMGH